MHNSDSLTLYKCSAQNMVMSYSWLILAYAGKQTEFVTNLYSCNFSYLLSCWIIIVVVVIMINI